jgi:nicotinate dehydrogenase subunit B
MRALAFQTRQQIFDQTGVLLVVRDPLPAPPAAPGQPPFIASKESEGLEILVAVWNDLSVTAMHGHVDLGTGLRTALTQIVAEELNVAPEVVHLLMGSTSAAPNQGATIASASIQIHSLPLQKASAQAHLWAIQACSKHWGCEVSSVDFCDGIFQNRSTQEVLSWPQLLQDKRIILKLDLQTPLKDAKDYRLIGTDFPRIDLPPKALGELIFVHDMRVPGMLHGRVIRPPYAGYDAGDFVGKTLKSVDESSIRHIPGVRAVVVKGDFVGVVAEREEHAEQAMRELSVDWGDWTGMRDLKNTEQALRANPYTQRTLIDTGNVDKAISDAEHLLERSYVWPYQMHASIGPSCALAMWFNEEDFQQNKLRARVWAGTQNPHALRADLALLVGALDENIDLIRMEAAGCYGRNCADDVAADALLLSRAVGAPVRVQLTREQENVWEPKGAAQLMQVRGGLNADKTVAGYDFTTSYPSNASPTLALLLTGVIEPVARTYEMGDRTAKPPYDWNHLRVTVNDMAPILRASWLRGVSALPNSFAHESFVDELAYLANTDPVEFRWRSIEDKRGKELIQMTAEKAHWQTHQLPQLKNGDGHWANGQGFAYARYFHSKWPGYGAAYAAWVADVQVNKNTGEILVKKVVVGHDAGLLINPKGVEHQVHGNVIQSTSRSLSEEVQTDSKTGKVVNLEWGSYPIINFRNVPMVEVYHMPRPDEPSLGAGESSSVPGTAAIANAIFDAIGVRLTNPPFTAEKVRAGLHSLRINQTAEEKNSDTDNETSRLSKIFKSSKRQGDQPLHRVFHQLRSALGIFLSVKDKWIEVGLIRGFTLLFIGFASSVLLYGGGQSEISKIRDAANPQTGKTTNFDESLIQRGRSLVAIGNCVGCHTQRGKEPFTGGRSIQTPFGEIVTPNITPHVQSGIGGWSYAAFERAMRQGISRDGHHLYPAFPYTSFQNIDDQDLMAIYAWLMSQEPVNSPLVQSNLKFPYSQRELMPIWNSLFAQKSKAPISSAQNNDQAYLRGKYLVETLGHCSQCHSARNALGGISEKDKLSGGFVDGWYAPALSAQNPSPVPWTKVELLDYLSTGRTTLHGIAGGPMAQIIRELANAPSEDKLAIAEYLAAIMNPSNTDHKLAKEVADKVVQSSITAEQENTKWFLQQELNAGKRQFEGSCASCHHDGDGPKLLGTNLHLSLNSNMYADTPDNLIRIIFEGVREPASTELGFMPAFKDSLTDKQLSQMVAYMRFRFAPELPAWQNLEHTANTIRTSLNR